MPLSADQPDLDLAAEYRKYLNSQDRHNFFQQQYMQIPGQSSNHIYLDGWMGSVTLEGYDTNNQHCRLTLDVESVPQGNGDRHEKTFLIEGKIDLVNLVHLAPASWPTRQLKLTVHSANRGTSMFLVNNLDVRPDPASNYYTFRIQGREFNANDRFIELNLGMFSEAGKLIELPPGVLDAAGLSGGTLYWPLEAVEQMQKKAWEHGLDVTNPLLIGSIPQDSRTMLIQLGSSQAVDGISNHRLIYVSTKRLSNSFHLCRQEDMKVGQHIGGKKITLSWQDGNYKPLITMHIEGIENITLPGGKVNSISREIRLKGTDGITARTVIVAEDHDTQDELTLTLAVVQTNVIKLRRKQGGAEFKLYAEAWPLAEVTRVRAPGALNALTHTGPYVVTADDTGEVLGEYELKPGREIDRHDLIRLPNPDREIPLLKDSLERLVGILNGAGLKSATAEGIGDVLLGLRNFTTHYGDLVEAQTRWLERMNANEKTMLRRIQDLEEKLKVYMDIADPPGLMDDLTGDSDDIG